MNIMSKATGHFKSKMNGGLECYEVKEWESKVWFKPSATIKQTEAVMKLHQEGKTMEAMVEVLIMRALDEEGAPLFKSADKFELMNGVDPTVITEVAGYILSFEPEQEDIAKN